MTVSMDSREDAGQMAALIEAAYPVLSDPGGRVARAYGVYNLLEDGVAAPSTFIIGKDSQVLWSYVGKDAGDRPAATLVLQKVDALVR